MMRQRWGGRRDEEIMMRKLLLRTCFDSPPIHLQFTSASPRIESILAQNSLRSTPNSPPIHRRFTSDSDPTPLPIHLRFTVGSHPFRIPLAQGGVPQLQRRPARVQQPHQEAAWH
eukprot:224225-Pyramimonas_sp.AAC.1